MLNNADTFIDSYKRPVGIPIVSITTFTFSLSFTTSLNCSAHIFQADIPGYAGRTKFLSKKRFQKWIGIWHICFLNTVLSHDVCRQLVEIGNQQTSGSAAFFNQNNIIKMYTTERTHNTVLIWTYRKTSNIIRTFSTIKLPGKSGVRIIHCESKKTGPLFYGQ